MAYATYRCPTPDCKRTERAGRPPHWNPCPACRQPVGFYILAPEPAEPVTATGTFADAGGL